MNIRHNPDLDALWANPDRGPAKPSKPKAPKKKATKKGGKKLQKATDFYTVAPEDIHVMEGFNPREIFDVEAFLDDIKINGVQVPLIARKADKGAEHGKPLELIDGERRLRASLEAELDSVPVRVIPSTVSKADAVFLALETGAGSKALDAYEEARAVDSLVKEGITPKQIAERFGKTEQWVSQRRSILKACKWVVGKYRKGEITYTLLRKASTKKNAEAQKEYVKAQIEKAKARYGVLPGDGPELGGDDKSSDANGTGTGTGTGTGDGGETPPASTKPTGAAPGRPGKRILRQLIQDLDILDDRDSKTYTVDQVILLVKWCAGGDDAPEEADVLNALGI